MDASAACSAVARATSTASVSQTIDGRALLSAQSRCATEVFMQHNAPTTSLKDDLRELITCPRELWLIYLATFLEYMGVFSFLQTLPLWLSANHGMTDAKAGFWAATFSTIVTLCVFFVGGLADTIGVRRMLVLSFGITAITRLGMSLAPSANTALVALLTFALAFATTSPVLQTAVQRASSPRTRAFAFSLWYVSFNIAGALVGPMIDGVRAGFQVPDPAHPGKKILASHAVDIPLIGSHVMSAHEVILGLGFLFAVLAAAVTLLLRKDFEHRGQDAAPPTKKSHPFAAMREVLSDKLFWRFMLMLALLSLVRMMFQHMHFTWPKYITRMEGEQFPVGTVWSINSFLIIFMAPLGTAITRQYKPMNVLILGAFISALSPFVLVFGSSMPYQLGMILVLTIGEALWSPRLYEYNVSIAPRGREATYVSLAALPYFLAKFLVGPTSGLLLQHFVPEKGDRNPGPMWLIIGASTIIGPIGIVLLRNWISPPQSTEVVKAS
jgi:MFS family permease